MAIENRFGESSALSIGVEEEVMLLDRETHGPVGAVRELLAATDGVELPGTLKTELHASVVELTTDICGSADEAVESIRVLRSRTSEALEGLGLAMAAAGSHPFAEPEELPITDETRYVEMVGYAGVTARRQGVNGLHVHVGMPGSGECMRTIETVLPWLPMVLALSANSPYIARRATGLASNRAEILAQLPRSGAPPIFESYEAWETWIEGFIATGLMKDYTQVWWDVRPHPRFGTLEIRMPDQPTALEQTAGFVDLLRKLCDWALEHPAREPADRGLYQQNRWAAARFGPEAELIHEGSLCTARELYDRLPFETSLDPDVSEAALQLRHGDAEAACVDIVARTWP